jgi:hypothetical protein
MPRRPTLTLATFNRLNLVCFGLCFGAVMGALILVNMPLLASIEEPALWVLLAAGIVGAAGFAASRMCHLRLDQGYLARPHH